MSVHRIYVEKKEPYAVEAKSLFNEIHSLLLIKSLRKIRIINRYDVEGIDEDLFNSCINTVFSEPQLDNTYTALPTGEFVVFAVEFLPGQFDQRAASASECIQLISASERPDVKSARLFLVSGSLSEEELLQIKKHVINPVEAREADLCEKKTLKTEYEIPTTVENLTDFTKLDKRGLANFIKIHGLAMDAGDIEFCQKYFIEERRDPTITEIKMIDTYWSDHCRHTTFGTIIDRVEIENPLVQAAFVEYLQMRKIVYGENEKPICLMDLGTIGGKYLKNRGTLKNLDESDEINACSVKIKVDNDGVEEDWLLLFKNETHNHPTEIEPFGGAATCIGGAIRDPLANRGYVFQAMRVTGAGNPLVAVKDTIEGKLPQRKIVTTAAAGYSSYGNQIGLATGIVDELYHDGYIAKRMEIGAVVGAVLEKNVRREVPTAGDVVILLGGKTGRDGCGGATGSSKAHKQESLESCGAEVQKGNAPVERKLQRLFRTPEATLMIKRCNDFGAGGVSVAIGELADGLIINLDAVPKKYEGLDGTELAISESQERMAVVVEKKDAQRFIECVENENLEATIVAEVTADPRLIMIWNGNEICNISRVFLNSNGAEKHIKIEVGKDHIAQKETSGNLIERLREMAGDLNICCKKGLSERFDSTIGASTVLMPFGGMNQMTPIQAMVAKLPVEGETKTCSGMAWGYNPFISEKSEYRGAYLAVVESIAKLVATGFSKEKAYLTFQEYFKRLGIDPARWGSPFSSLLGALIAQKDLGVAAIGGKDSMSGSFEKIDVPPTLVSFAVASGCTDNIISPEFKKTGNLVVWLAPEYDDELLPNSESLCRVLATVELLISSKKAISAYAVGYGGAAEALFKMSLGNGIGFAAQDCIKLESLFGYRYGSFILELAEDCGVGKVIGKTTADFEFRACDETVALDEVVRVYEHKLSPVMPFFDSCIVEKVEKISFTGSATISPKIGISKPKVLIPVFPGTNCEYDSARAMRIAGAQSEVFVINNLTPSAVSQSVLQITKMINDSQMIFLPGGFSGGDEPEGSAKFITALFRAPMVAEAVQKLLTQRDGLMIGICNGFQALIKLGLVPFGKIADTDESCPTLTFNTIGRHQSMLAHTRIASTLSPWLSAVSVDDMHTIAISHGEGRFVADNQTLAKLIENGQIATQYVDLCGNPTMDLRYNPNGSYLAIEGITSPDGRIFGKMGHSERWGDNLYKNVPGNHDQKIFKSGVDYFML